MIATKYHLQRYYIFDIAQIFRPIFFTPSSAKRLGDDGDKRLKYKFNVVPETMVLYILQVKP